jgi:mRNA interferase HigB
LARPGQGVQLESSKGDQGKFSTASFLANNRVAFNISGNKYRLVVKVEYELKTVYIRFIGSHAEYDKIDASIV